ncbi:MAG: hypothetical protein ACREL6_02560, partial [Gemmatimonadales bacterium]
KLICDRILLVDRNPDCQAARELPEEAGRVLVVSEWGDFLDRFLEEPRPAAGPEDVIVPSPLMPHLMYEWLLRRARERWPGRTIETRPLPVSPDTPWDTAAPDGTRYISFADWICPTHCIEPALCPVIRAPRTWEMADRLEEITRRLETDGAAAGPVSFICRHVVHGVGAFGVRLVQEGNRRVVEAGAREGPVDLLVGTISSCHGAVNLLHLGAPVPRREHPAVLYSGVIATPAS